MSLNFSNSVTKALMTPEESLASWEKCLLL